ncbi:MAG: hypothetical protein U1U88_001019 [Lawsonella clevelandensis]
MPSSTGTLPITSPPAPTTHEQGANAKQLSELSHVKDLSVLSSGDKVAEMVMNAYGNSINVIFICIGIVSVLAFIGVLCMRSTVLRDSIDLEPSEYDSKNTAAGAAASRTTGKSKGKSVAGLADTANHGVPLLRTADRDDLQPMDLGEVWTWATTSACNASTAPAPARGTTPTTTPTNRSTPNPLAAQLLHHGAITLVRGIPCLHQRFACPLLGQLVIALL